MTSAALKDARSVPGQPDIWYFVLFETLIFGAYFVAYAICRAESLDLYLRSQATLSQGFGLANTLILLTSSWFVANGVQSARERKYDAALTWVLLAAACGGLFIALKVVEWMRKIGDGFTFTTNEFFGFYYFLTGIHVVHVLIGFVFLGVAAYQLRGALRRSQEIVETCATFWHMVDYLWIIIFALLYLAR